MGDFLDNLRAATQCDICGGLKPCKGCAKNYQPPGTSRTDDRVDVVLPLNEDGRPAVDRMLRERGYNPAEWEIRSLTVNEWDALGAATKTGNPVIKLRQTKAHLTRIVPIEDTPWGQLAGVLETLATPVPTKRHLRNGDPAGGVTVLIGDDQAPFHDPELHEAACAALSEIKPSRLIYMGDGCDFDALSKYEPQHPEWISTVNDSLRTMRTLLTERLDAAGNPEAWFLEGNHEARLRKFLMSKAPALFGLKSADLPAEAPSVLSLHSLLGLGSLNVELADSPLGGYPHPMVQIAPGFVAAHGWIARQGGGNSARASVERMNASVATGHTHRLANVAVTRWDDSGQPHIYHAVETGTMADGRGLGYSKHPDWQPGFATVETWSDGHTSVDLAAWRNGHLTWRNLRW